MIALPYVDLPEEAQNQKLSRLFTLRQFLVSGTAARKELDNTPDERRIENLRQVALDLDVISQRWAEPVIICSGLRMPKVNVAVGGAKNSAHMHGLAGDIKPHALTLARSDAEQKEWLRVYYKLIVESDLPFDQLIIEGTQDGAEWIHYARAPQGKQPRRMKLEATGGVYGGPMRYREFVD